MVLLYAVTSTLCEKNEKKMKKYLSREYYGNKINIRFAMDTHTQLTVLLYDNNITTATRQSTLLMDLDMPDLHRIHSVEQKLLTYDKLNMQYKISTIINRIINVKISEACIPVKQQIINHTYDNNDLIIMIYAHGYKLVYNHNCYVDVGRYREIWMRRAIANGMRIDNIRISFTDDSVSYLQLARRIIVIGNESSISDATLHSCTGITKLQVYTNQKITTCEPFAKSLIALSVGCPCNISDAGLVLCTNIVQLHANNNTKITTCVPFANSLEILLADGVCGIGDVGLSSCTHIVNLSANSNRKITTCVPFANSLKILSVTRHSGIGNNGISSCTNIKNLNADSNKKITVCGPFAKSLRTLSATGASGITDTALVSCINITVLYADHNPKITTCGPFSKSLHILHATNNSGITDRGLRACKNIEELRADENPKITTCDPFARSLKILFACDKCGITDDGLQLCSNLWKIETENNKNITHAMQIILLGRPRSLVHPMQPNVN